MSVPLDSLIALLGTPLRESNLEKQFSLAALPPVIPAAVADTHSNAQLGIEVIVSRDDSVRTIFLYGRGTERFSQFDGELPDGLTFSSTRRDVHRVFGSPTLSAEPQVLEYLGPKGAWDRYDLPAAHIHFQYHRYQSGIEMITLMAPGTAP